MERFESVSYRMCAVGGKKLESSISKFSKSLLLMLFAFWPQVSFADVPIWLGQASKICTGQQYRDAQGVLQTGTKNCAASACGEDGQVSCVTNTNFKSALASGAGAKIVSGNTIAGINGSGSVAPADCNSNFQQSCVATSAYQAVSPTNLTAANIKNGVSIAGLTGTYPSSQNLLAGADAGMTDLSSSSLNSQLASATTYEWFTADGTRETASGDADLAQASNIKASVVIFGVTGTLSTGITSADAWNIRAGVRYDGVSGKMNMDCRNGLSLTTYDVGGLPYAATVDSSTNVVTSTAHGFANDSTVRFTSNLAPGGLTAGSTYYVVSSTTNTFQLASSSGGSAIDITSTGSNVVFYLIANGSKDYWDTIEDYNNNNGALSALATSPGSVGSGWSSINFCGGIDGQGSSSDDDNVWKDVSVNATSTSTSEACSSGNHCMFQDKISGLSWSKQQANSDWDSALATCDGLDWGGSTNWRLPSQKEVVEAYNHGIFSAGATNWMTSSEMNQNVWSSTTFSNSTMSAFAYNLATGISSASAKSTGTNRVICVK